MAANTATPKCNHCGKEIDSDDIWHGEYTVGSVDTDDGAVSRLKCPNCKEHFHTMCEHTYTFTAVDEDGEEIYPE